MALRCDIVVFCHSNAASAVSNFANAMREKEEFWRTLSVTESDSLTLRLSNANFFHAKAAVGDSMKITLVHESAPPHEDSALVH